MAAFLRVRWSLLVAAQVMRHSLWQSNGCCLLLVKKLHKCQMTVLSSSLMCYFLDVILSTEGVCNH